MNLFVIQSCINS